MRTTTRIREPTKIILFVHRKFSLNIHATYRVDKEVDVMSLEHFFGMESVDQNITHLRVNGVEWT